MPSYKYITIGYEERYSAEELNIRPEDETRAEGNVFTAEEQRDFSRVSSVNQPTYGTCDGCWSSGPLAQNCPFCPAEGGAKDTLGRFCLAKTAKGEVVDSQKLSAFWGASHQRALASALANWVYVPQLLLLPYDDDVPPMAARKLQGAGLDASDEAIRQEVVHLYEFLGTPITHGRFKVHDTWLGGVS